jgi:hypothetical protein
VTDQVSRQQYDRSAVYIPTHCVHSPCLSCYCPIHELSCQQVQACGLFCQTRSLIFPLYSNKHSCDTFCYIQSHFRANEKVKQLRLLRQLYILYGHLYMQCVIY